MAQAGLTFAREIERNIFYKEVPKPIGTRRADFVVEGKVLVELKAISELEEVHIAQLFKLSKSISTGSGVIAQFRIKKFDIQKD